MGLALGHDGTLRFKRIASQLKKTLTLNQLISAYELLRDRHYPASRIDELNAFLKQLRELWSKYPPNGIMAYEQAVRARIANDDSLRFDEPASYVHEFICHLAPSLIEREQRSSYSDYPRNNGRAPTDRGGVRSPLPPPQRADADDKRCKTSTGGGGSNNNGASGSGAAAAASPARSGPGKGDICRQYGTEGGCTRMRGCCPPPTQASGWTPPRLSAPCALRRKPCTWLPTPTLPTSTPTSHCAPTRTSVS